MQVAKSRRLSRITITWGVYIVISAAFMLQVRSWLVRVFGDSIVMASFKICFLLIAILTIIYAASKHRNIFRLSVIFALFLTAYLFSRWQPYFSEKTHVLTYGLLGYLAAKDLIVPRAGLQFKNIALAICLLSLISGLDELFQGILPYRVCELRDFITNIISGTLGIGLFYALKMVYSTQ